MDPLGWLGLRKTRHATPNLSAIHEIVRGFLPDDEPVVIRYVVVVAVLLTRVAHSDGSMLHAELEHLRNVFRHIDRMPPTGIDSLCSILNERVPRLTESELDLCYHEIKSLCDGAERRQVLRLLMSQATADGQIAAQEHGALLEIARSLGIEDAEVASLEVEALGTDRLPRPPDSVIPSAPSHGGLAAPPSDERLR